MSQLKFLDGGMGSELIRRGEIFQPYVWAATTNLSNPTLVCQVHIDYVNAGAQYLTANTFRTTPRAYEKTGLAPHKAKEKAYLSLKSAMHMVKVAADEKDKKIQVLGSIAPLEDCYMPELFPGKEKALKEFTQLGVWLKECGADGILLETMNSIVEARTALNAVSSLDLPVWVSFYLANSQNIASGESIDDAISMVENYPVECLLINCNTLNITSFAVDNVVDKWTKNWGVYPNLGVGNPSPDAVIKRTHSNDKYFSIIKKAVDAGASVIGGCCGATPDHISLLKQRFS